MHISVLPQVDGSQVKAKNVDGITQLCQPTSSQFTARMSEQRGRHDIEVLAKFARARICWQRHFGLTYRLRACERRHRRGEARIHADQCLTIRLVLAMRRTIAGFLCQCHQRFAGLDQAARHRQFSAQMMHFEQVVLKRDRRLPPYCALK